MGSSRTDASSSLVAAALALGLWYVVLPAKPLVDIAFLAFLPLVLLGKYFNTIYVPLYGPLKDIVSGCYLIAHPDLHKTPRVRAFFDFMIAEIEQFRPMLMGRTSDP